MIGVAGTSPAMTHREAIRPVPAVRAGPDMRAGCTEPSMPTSSTDFHSQALRSLVIGLALAVLQGPAAPQNAAPTQPQASAGVRTVLSTATTVTGEPIKYPSAAPAQMTALEITLQPGQQTGWHTHPVPTFGCILDGELTVDYGPKGQRVYRKGDGFAEATNEAHNGRNLTEKPVTILAVFAGMEGVKDSVPASPPARP
jgi:quercetin dioxygenase-like cupin family protein